MNASYSKTPSGRGALWLCYGGMLCLAVAVNLTPVYLTTFSEVFGGTVGLDEEQLGRIPAITFAGIVLGILLSGPLADRWGARLFTLIGLALTCVGLAIMAVAANYAMLLASVAIMGFGTGILDMVLSPIVCALQPEKRSSAMNWLHSFYCIGAVGTVLIGSAALRFGVPWRAVCAALLLLPAVLLVGFARAYLPPLVHEDEERIPLARLLGQPFFLLALCAIFLSGATEAGMAQWLPAYAELELGYAKETGGMALAGFSVAMVVGRVSAGAVQHRIRPVLVMLVCCVVLAGLYAMGCFFPVAPVALAACVAAGLFVSCLWPTTLGVTADRFPHGGATMFALLAGLGNAGCFVLPWVEGIVAKHSSLTYGVATAGLCPVIMLPILGWIGYQRWKGAQAG